jgi:hypothetical protein
MTMLSEEGTEDTDFLIDRCGSKSTLYTSLTALGNDIVQIHRVICLHCTCQNRRKASQERVPGDLIIQTVAQERVYLLNFGHSQIRNYIN